MQETKKMGALCWFDIPYDDQKRAQTFYKELFGWSFADWSEGPMTYFGIEGSHAESPNPKAPTCSGGLMPRQHPMQGVQLYFRVPNIDEWCQKVESLGGRVLQGKMEIPEWGELAVCQDTEGNAFAIWCN